MVPGKGEWGVIAEAVYWSRAVPSPGFSSSRGSCSPSTLSNCPPVQCLRSGCSGWSCVLFLLCIIVMAVKPWLFWEGPGPCRARREEAVLQVMLAHGPLCPPCLRLCRETPWGDECLGDPSWGPCYGWEPGAGLRGVSPGPLSSLASTSGISALVWALQRLVPSVPARDRVAVWGCCRHPPALEPSSGEIPGGCSSVRARRCTDQDVLIFLTIHLSSGNLFGN